MMVNNDCRSDEQMYIEKHLIQHVRRILGDIEILPNPVIPLQSTTGATICPDFYSEHDCVIGEVFAHRGKMKTGQTHKIAMDILKMLLLDQEQHKKYKKYLVVCSTDVEKYLMGKSALAVACRQFEIQIMNLESELSNTQIEMLETAQKRQDFYIKPIREG